MDKQRLLSTISTLETEKKKLEDKSFNFYFFVLDTKGNPSATLRYIYQTAYTLKELGYNVTMLHQEKEFVGVENWLGEKYASLPHKNVQSENVDISASDFLFIPEIYANVMSQTKNLPCKRVALLTNMNYLTEIIPVGVTWGDMGIDEVITTSKHNEITIKDYFPFVKSHIVSPYVPNVFRRPTKPQDLIVNFVSREPSDINKIIKPFFWKYPIYKWVSFRDLRGLPQDVFADALREGAITVWVDDDTNFGMSLLEAVKCGTLTLAKVPKVASDWMVNDENVLTNSVIWFEDIKRVPDMIASVVRTWLIDEIPSDIEEEAKKLDGLYTKEQHVTEVKETYENGLIADRVKEIEEAIKQFQAQLNNEEKAQ